MRRVLVARMLDYTPKVAGESLTDVVEPADARAFVSRRDGKMIRAPSGPFHPMLAKGEHLGKRAIDLVFAMGLLILFAPLMSIIWCAVTLTSAGPGLHWSPRVGRGGRMFRMPKFRTMSADAPLGPRELFWHECEVTSLGQFLRRTSLDELPQLFSILCGDMSVIGPRPLLESDPAARARLAFPDALAVRPGLSGLAQISGRNQVTPRRKARLDAFYVRKMSFGYDLTLMIRTLMIVASGRGLK